MEATPTDRQLLERTRNSDVEAFRILFDRYQPMVFRYALFRTRETDLSHDIVQETFLRIWEHRGSLKPHLSFLAYAFRISGNLAHDAARHRQVQEKAPLQQVPEGDNPEELVQLTMIEQRLSEIITKLLPERCRMIFLLSRYEGKSYQEIAGILGLSVKTVENQIGHALKVVRRNLKGYVE